jgi:hypothetical protein
MHLTSLIKHLPLLYKKDLKKETERLTCPHFDLNSCKEMEILGTTENISPSQLLQR